MHKLHKTEHWFNTKVIQTKYEKHIKLQMLEKLQGLNLKDTEEPKHKR